MSKSFAPLEKISFKIIEWVGTPYSVILHTLVFLFFSALAFFKIFSVNTVLLIFTTWLSCEAIYLSIFIQMSVNRNTESLEEVEEDIVGIQEEASEEEEAHKVLIHIGQQMRTIQHEIDILKKSGLLKPSAVSHRIHS